MFSNPSRPVSIYSRAIGDAKKNDKKAINDATVSLRNFSVAIQSSSSPENASANDLSTQTRKQKSHNRKQQLTILRSIRHTVNYVLPNIFYSLT